MEKSRQELFELVWAMPMTKLFKQFELSDVGLLIRGPLKQFRSTCKPIIYHSWHG
jgi:hypothetical protein